MGELVHVPFFHGVTESVDEKLLPDGWLTSAKNVRFSRDGRLVRRLGYTATLNYVFDPLDDGRLYAFRDEKLWWDTGMKFYREDGTDDPAWLAKSFYLQVMPGELTRRSVCRDFASDTMDAATIGDVTCTVIGNQASGTCVVRVYQGAALLAEYRLGTALAAPKIVRVGTRFIIAARSNSTSMVRGAILDTADLSAGLSSGFDLFGCASGAPFDVSDGDATEWTLVTYLSARVRVIRIDADGATIASNSTETNPADVTALGVEGGAGGDSIFVAWRTTAGVVAYRTFTASGATISASHSIATIETDTLNMGAPALARDTATAATLYWNRTRATTGVADHHIRTCTIDNAGTAGTVTQKYGGRLVSKIGTFAANRYGVAVDAVGLDRAYYLINLTEGKPRAVAAFARTVAPQVTSRPLCLPRLDLVGTTAMSYGALVIAAGDPSAASPVLGADLVTWTFSAADRQAVTAHGSLWFTGAVPLLYSGETVVREAGFLGSPAIESATTSNVAGGLESEETYAYKITWSRVDADGKIETSIPSEPFLVTTPALHDTVETAFRFPKWTFQNSSAFTSAAKWRVHVWRTTKGPGQTYYRVTPDLGVLVTMSDENQDLAYSDGMPDTDLLARQVLYTDVGDQIAHAQVPAHRFAAVGDDRLFLGGLEDDRLVTWSKFFTPGEGIHFADAPNFRRSLPEAVTAVAALDSRFIAFTAAGVYETAGDGPDDTGAGEYPPFRRLPSSVGCSNHHSLLLTDEGLFFQASEGALYLLPRGGGTPLFQGEHVRGTLAAFPLIVAAVLVPASQLALFACQNTARTAGVLLVYDLRNKEWTTDEIAGGAPVDSLTVWGDQIGLRLRDQDSLPWVETPGVYADAGAFYSSELVTGDMRPFGDRGWGQIVGAHPWGEYRADCGLEIALSFDSGATYAAGNTGTWDMLAADGLTAGAAFDRQLYSATRKASRVRARIKVIEKTAGQNDTEGLVLNGMSLEVIRSRSLPRLQADARR
jgi:hypothetical protein